MLVPKGDCGGPGLLDHCIIRIDTRKGTLYQHEKFRVGELTAAQGTDKKWPWEVFIDGILHARFKKNSQAVKFMSFIQGHVFAI